MWLIEFDLVYHTIPRLLRSVKWISAITEKGVVFTTVFKRMIENSALLLVFLTSSRNSLLGNYSSKPLEISITEKACRFSDHLKKVPHHFHTLPSCHCGWLTSPFLAHSKDFCPSLGPIFD